jgi:hypothetical protein
MGKVKRSKKHNNNVEKKQSNSSKTSFNVTALEEDLASIQENKRIEACTILSELFTFNKSNPLALEKLTSKNILSKIQMRLVDSSDEVRFRAAFAIKALSETEHIEIHKRLYNIGLFKSAISLSIEKNSLAIHNGDYVSELLTIVTNILINLPTSLNAVTSNAIFSSQLIYFIINFPHTDIMYTSMNLLNTLSSMDINIASEIIALIEEIKKIWNLTELSLLKINYALTDSFNNNNNNKQMIIEINNLNEIFNILRIYEFFVDFFLIIINNNNQNTDNLNEFEHFNIENIVLFCLQIISTFSVFDFNNFDLTNNFEKNISQGNLIFFFFIIIIIIIIFF